MTKNPSLWMSKSLALTLVMTFAVFVRPALAATIGLSLPLGGDAAPLARQFLAGAELAMSRLGKGHELFVTDDGCNEEIGQLAALDMARTEPAIVTGFLCNEPAMAAATRFSKTGIPVLVAGAGSIRLIKDREREDWNLWRMSPGDNDPAKTAASAIQADWDEKTFALVDDGSIYGRTYIDALRQELAKLDLAPQFTDTFRAAQSSQAGLLRRLERSGVSAAFIAATDAEDLLVIAKNLKKMEIPLEIMTSDALAVLPFIEDNQQTATGIKIVMQREWESSGESEFLRSYLEEKNLPINPFLFAGYAAIEVSVSAIGDTPDATTRNLSQMNFDTVIGPVRFAQDGSNLHNPYIIRTWNGETLSPASSATRQAPESQ